MQAVGWGVVVEKLDWDYEGVKVVIAEWEVAITSAGDAAQKVDQWTRVPLSVV